MSEQSEIESAIDDFVKAYNSGDRNSVLSYYGRWLVVRTMDNVQ